MEAHIAVAKVGKYATSISGDTVEIIERPNGGLSCVIADGQWSGKSAKAISNVVTRKALSLLADGVRDGAAARAASDYLFTYRAGKVQATLNILSLDLSSQTMVITRNNPAPVLLVRTGEIQLLDASSCPVGTRHGIRPDISEVGLTPGLACIVFTDGLVHAGKRKGEAMDMLACTQDLISAEEWEADAWADTLLNQALHLDDGRPADDISVVVAIISNKADEKIRRISAHMPF